jgi:hypothetical protein
MTQVKMQTWCCIPRAYQLTPVARHQLAFHPSLLYLQTCSVFSGDLNGQLNLHEVASFSTTSTMQSSSFLGRI